MSKRMDLFEQVNKLDVGDSEFGRIFALMCEKTDRQRKAAGVLPYDVWIAAIQALGVCPSLEFVPTESSSPGELARVWLKIRKGCDNVTVAEEESWGDKLHIPGVILTPTKTMDQWLEYLLRKEVLDHSLPDLDQRVAIVKAVSEIKTIAWYSVPERNSTGLTIVMSCGFSKDTVCLQKDFEPVTKENLNKVIRQHKTVVNRILQHSIEKFTDSR